jgi:hypothetical protein
MTGLFLIDLLGDHQTARSIYDSFLRAANRYATMLVQAWPLNVV